MKALIDKIIDILYQHTGEVCVSSENAAMNIAEECKKIAIEFHEKCPTTKSIWVKDHYLTTEEFFDEFIQNYENR